MREILLDTAKMIRTVIYRYPQREFGIDTETFSYEGETDKWI